MSEWGFNQKKETKRIIETIQLCLADESQCDELKNSLTRLGLFVHVHDTGCGDSKGGYYQVVMSNKSLTEEIIEQELVF